MALVWSSGVGRICPSCGKAEEACRCPRSARAAASGKGGSGGSGGKRAPSRPGAPPPSGAERGGAAAGKVVVRLEKKGRAGKAVTVIEGLPLGEAELAAAAKELKSRSGTGGTVREGILELQGDKVELAKSWLREKGYSR